MADTTHLRSIQEQMRLIPMALHKLHQLETAVEAIKIKTRMDLHRVPPFPAVVTFEATPILMDPLSQHLFHLKLTQSPTQSATTTVDLSK